MIYTKSSTRKKKEKELIFFPFFRIDILKKALQNYMYFVQNIYINTVNTGYNVLSHDQNIWYVITEVRYQILPIKCSGERNGCIIFGLHYQYSAN